MKRVEKYAEEIVNDMEQWKSAAWVDDIDKSTMERVITVCQNIVKSWAIKKERGKE